MVNVYVSSVIDAPCEKVWETIRPFDSIYKWHHLVKEARIELGLPADKIGCVRHMTLEDGSTIREKLLGLSDYDHVYTYSILESQMAVTDYIASLRATPITEDNRSFMEWSAEFDCPPDEQSNLQDLIAKEVFGKGLEDLAKFIR